MKVILVPEGLPIGWTVYFVHSRSRTETRPGKLQENQDIRKKGCIEQKLIQTCLQIKTKQVDKPLKHKTKQII